LRKHQVFLEKKASNQLDKLSEDARSRIIVALDILWNEGFSPRLNIKKLQGYKNHYRLRVGKFRILFELRSERTIVVYAILLRKAAYRK